MKSVTSSVEAIRSEEYDVIIINFANPDMVGHTGVEEAAIKAVEAVDDCVGRAVEALKEVGGQMFICADHGNAEHMVDYETGEPLPPTPPIRYPSSWSMPIRPMAFARAESSATSFRR